MDHVIYFPLKKNLLFVTTNGLIYTGKIKFAGDDFVTILNLRQKMIQPDGSHYFINVGSNIKYRRDLIAGYETIEETNPQTNSVIPMRRDNE